MDKLREAIGDTIETDRETGYPVYIVNRATQALYWMHGQSDESYQDFLKRVRNNFDVKSACESIMAMDTIMGA